MANENFSQLVSQQIEETADLYEPAVYDLLTFYSALQRQNDELTGQFLPLSSVTPKSPKDVKVFAVGIMPPSARVTARLLDRSATLNSIADGGAQDLDLSIPGLSGISGSGGIPTGPTSTTSTAFPEQFVVMCNRLQCMPEELAKVLSQESGMRASAVCYRDKDNKPCAKGSSPDCHPVAKGLNQLTLATAKSLGMTEDEWNVLETKSEVEQLKWVEKFFAKKGATGKTAAELKAANFGGFNNKDGSIYHSDACKKGFANCEFQEKAYKQNISADKAKKGYITTDDLAAGLRELSQGFQSAIDEARANLGMGSDTTPVEADSSQSKTWQTVGTVNRGEASKAASKTADKNLNYTEVGVAFLKAQAAMAQQLQSAIETMAGTPPLRLLVNPQSFKLTPEKIISEGNWGRNGPIIEHWGDNQDKLEVSGKIAAFYSMDASGQQLIPIKSTSPTPGSPGNGPGLGRTARQFSQSYQNFLSLWLLYKNNGGVWLPDINDPTGRQTNLSLLGSIYIYYDDTLYVGSFDSFNINEDETVPFSLSYDFSFTVRAWFLLDRVADPTLTYGAPRYFQSIDPAKAPTGSPTDPFTAANNEQPEPDVALPYPLNVVVA